MLRLAIFLCLCLIISINAFTEPKKNALIVAVGDYPESSGWSQINSANDVPIIKSALNYHGFLNENIEVLKDEDATKAGMLNAIDELYNRVNEGDVVYFHFSGHGQQIIDKVGDEIDGLDEALVPYNAGKSYELCPAKGENHFRDDLLGVLLNKIREKIGPEGDLMVVLDACHSGTATRGIGVSRGTEMVFRPPDQMPVLNEHFHIDQGFLEPKSDEDLSPMVVFSGSSATEQNYEYIVDNVSYGSLSFALSKAFHQIDANSTYRSIFGKIQVKMSSMVPRQNPQLEGDADRLIFAGEAVDQTNYANIKLWRDETSVVLDAGQLNGINYNTTVELYPIGTINPSESKPLSTGKVVNAQLAEALVILDNPIEKEIAEKSWVFVKEYSFGSESLPIKISGNIPSTIKNLLRRQFDESNVISIIDKNPELLIEVVDEPKPHLIIISKDDRVIFNKRITENNFQELVGKAYKQIKLYAQAQLLRSLESTNERIRVSFELIPVKFDENFNEISRSSIDSKTNKYGQIVFNDGDFFKVRITNHGSRTAFYSLIDIQPDNAINILIPEKDSQGNPYRAPSDCKIEAGKTEELRAVFYIKEPYGQEVFKLISSNRPLNLDQILHTRGQVDDRSILHPFEALFADSFDLLTRDSNLHRLPPETIHIHTLVFEVAPKE